LTHHSSLLCLDAIEYVDVVRETKGDKTTFRVFIRMASGLDMSLLANNENEAESTLEEIAQACKAVKAKDD
jgi:hypothetical protein